MKKTFRLGAAASLAWAVVLWMSAGAQPKWRLYTAPDNSFSVEVPWKPIYRIRRTITSSVSGDALGPFTGTMAEDPYDLSMYVDEQSTHFQIKVYSVAQARDEIAFERESDSVVLKIAGDKSNILKRESVSVNGLQALHYVYAHQKAQSRILIVNGNHRIFMLWFFTEDKKGIDRGPVNKVFNTFQPSP